MPILGILASSTQVAAGDFESIATVTVGAGGSSSITFSSIPSTYAHLQIRALGRSTRATTNDSVAARFNSDTTGYGTTGHVLYGNGASVFASSDWISGSSNYAYIGEVCGDNAGTDIFGVFVTDILDYANTNKYKTVRLLGGNDRNGGGTYVNASVNLWRSTSAINQIRLYNYAGSTVYFTSGSVFSLYGIKAA